MKKGLFTCFIVWLLCLVVTAAAADTTDIRFEYKKERTSEKEVVLSVVVHLAPGIKLYAKQQRDADVLYSNILFDTAAAKFYSGAVTEHGKMQSEHDSSVNADVHFYTDSVKWQQKINLATGDSLSTKVYLNYLYKNGQEYLPGEATGRFYLEPEADTTTDNNIADRSFNMDIPYSLRWGLAGVINTLCLFNDTGNRILFYQAQQNKAGG
ncbi:hypothetical protein [Niabella hibiscisoli]|uniref:hypothetical protein n=1 Tax=Niabella hibiscisoli TaxID=1825928 RepID=UPI001F115862|nr:hypothetical protein [Niabella hibiscisoli]MCH5720101.1 hypothetical protein [Niabella hibiscisoli]